MTTTTASRDAAGLPPDASLVTITHVTYALHALGLAIGAFGASTVVGSFVFGWPSIIAVIINYVKRGEARGTWLESHFTLADPHLLVRACCGPCLVFLVGAAAGHRAGRLRRLDRRLRRRSASGRSTASPAAGWRSTPAARCPEPARYFFAARPAATVGPMIFAGSASFFGRNFCERSLATSVT